MAEIPLGDVVARLKVDTTAFTQPMQQAAAQVNQFAQTTTQASGQLRNVEQAAQQTSRALSQLPFTAIQNAIDAFSRSIQNAGNSQDRYRTAITQAQEALRQFQVTTNASGEMVDRFGNRLSQAATDSLRQFRTGIQEARAELHELQRFGINAQAQVSGGPGGGVLQTVLGIAGGIGVATGLAAIAREMKDLVTTSVTLSAKMQDLALAFRAIDGSSAAANKTLTFLFATAQRLGVDFERVAEGFKRMDQAAKGTSLEGEGIRQVFENVVAGARTLGVSSAQTSQALVALEQILTKGKLSAEEYRRQLGNAVPGALKLMADGLGFTTKQLEQMVTLGLIPAETALIAFGNAAGELRAKSGVETVEQLTGTFARLKNETTAWMTALGDSISSTLQPFLADLIKISEELRKIFDIKAPGVQGVPGANQESFLSKFFPGLLTPTTLGMPAPGTTGPTEQPGPRLPSPALGFARSQYDELIRQQAERANLDAEMFSRLIQAESNFNAQARGPMTRRGERAMGLGQILPSTGADYGLTTYADLLDPTKNVTASANILRDYTAKLKKDFGDLDDLTRLALAAYNAGIGNVEKAINETVKAGEKITYGQVLGRLPMPEQTGPYVEKIAGPYTRPGEGSTVTPWGTLPTGAAPPAAAPEATAPLNPFAPMLKNASEVLEAIGAIQGLMDKLSSTEFNRGGILNEALKAQADEAIKKYTQLALQLATVPKLFEQMQPAQKEVVRLAGEQVLLVQQRLAEEAQTPAAAQRRVAELRAIEAAQERLDAQQLAADEQNAQRTVHVFRQREEEVEKNREALVALAATYGLTVDALNANSEAENTSKQARDLATASTLAASQAGTVYETQTKTLTDALRERLAIEGQIPQRRREAAASARAGQEAIDQQRVERRFEGTLTDQLERLRTPQNERLEQRLRAQARRERIQLGPDEEAQLQAISHQERLNEVLEMTRRIGDTVANSLTQGLLSIIDGTKSVSEGFAAMAKSILDSIAQITLNEGFRQLISLGIGVLAGALVGGGTAPAVGGGTSFASTGTSTGPSVLSGVGRGTGFLGTLGAQGGAIVHQPTMMMVGENPATSPEYILNRQQMASLMRAGPSAGGQATGGGISIINVSSQEQADREAARERGLGKQVVMNYITEDLSSGSGSRIGQLLRAGQR